MRERHLTEYNQLTHLSRESNFVLVNQHHLSHIIFSSDWHAMWALVNGVCANTWCSVQDKVFLGATFVTTLTNRHLQLSFQSNHGLDNKCGKLTQLQVRSWQMLQYAPRKHAWHGWRLSEHYFRFNLKQWINPSAQFILMHARKQHKLRNRLSTYFLFNKWMHYRIRHCLHMLPCFDHMHTEKTSAPICCVVILILVRVCLRESYTYTLDNSRAIPWWGRDASTRSYQHECTAQYGWWYALNQSDLQSIIYLATNVSRFNELDSMSGVEGLALSVDAE